MKCSVAMTTYNGSKYIIEMLESIRTQTRQPNEFRICDDGSSDDTVEIVEEYIEHNNLNNWQIIRNEQNLGWRLNFRKVLGLCSNELIFLADQDDIWMPTKIEDMCQVMREHKEISCLASNYRPFFSGEADGKEEYKVKGIDNNDGRIKQVDFRRTGLSVLRPGCTYCIRKDLLEEMQQYDLKEYSHDGVLWSLAILNDAAYYYNKVLINFRRHGDNASTPESHQNLKRRLTEIDNAIMVCKWAIKYLQEKNTDSGKLEIEKKALSFVKKRRDIIVKKSPVQMTLFALVNRSHYPTTRNMLGDIYICLKERTHANNKDK